MPSLQPTFLLNTVQLMTGYSAEEFLLDPQLGCRIILPEDLAPLRAALERAIEAGHGIVGARFTHRRGHVVRVQGRVSVVHDLAGLPTRLDVLAWLDEPMSPPLNELLDELPDPVVVVGNDGLIKAANARIGLLGYARGELVGQPVELLVPARMRAGHRHKRSGEGRAKEPRSMGKGPFFALARDGTEVPVDISLGPLSGSEYVIAIIRDLRPQRRLEDLTREADRRFQTTFEQAAVGLTHVGLDACWLAVNRKMTEITGYSEAELVGRSVLEITPAEDAEVDLQLADGALKDTKSTWVREKRYRRKDGRVVWVRITSSLARDDAGQPAYFVNVVEDIDLLRRSEEVVRQAQKMDALGRMASGIAHDFNNLLAVILSYSDGLATDDSLGAEQRADAEEIRATARRAALLTRQMLAFGRGQVMRARAVDCAQCFAGLERLLKPLLGSGVSLTWHVADHTRPCFVDPGHLEQVIVNLAINARDAMAGKGALSLLSREETLRQDNAHGLPAGNFVALDIRDTGVGIAPEVLARIFEPFFTTKEVGLGTGLGLATVQAIVNQSGGALEVHSRPGEGTIFTVLLPVAEEDELAAPGSDPATASEEPRGRGEHLLVVEDDPAVRRLMHAVLSRAGYLVTLASNGAEGLFIANQPGMRFDAVVTDVEMPLLNGVDLVARLRSSAPRLKRLFISAAAGSQPLPADAPRLGKPFSQGQLLQAVAALFPREEP